MSAETLMLETIERLLARAELDRIVLAGLGIATDERRASHRRFYAEDLDCTERELARRAS